MNAATKLEKNSAYGRLAKTSVPVNQNSPSTVDPNAIAPSTTSRNGCPGDLLTRDTRAIVLDELRHGVTAIEITPIGIIRHYDKRSAYPTDDLPIPFTLTDKAREYFERGKKV